MSTYQPSSDAIASLMAYGHKMAQDENKWKREAAEVRKAEIAKLAAHNRKHGPATVGKTKSAVGNLAWARRIGKEAIELVNAGRSISPLAEKHKIPRSTLIGYMKRYHGYKPVSACGQKRKEFTPEQVKWAFAERVAGKTLRQIATALGVAVSTLRHNIVLPDAPARRSSFRD